MSADFRDIVLAIANERPRMHAATVVALALAIENAHPDLNDAAALARWAQRQPEVMEHVAADKKINAIREVRALTGASLKQAKDAIDRTMSGGTR